MNEWLETYHFYVASMLFSAGVFVVITKKNLVFILIGIELMLNAGNLLFAFFSQADKTLNGQTFAIFSIVLTVCEVAIALAILLNIYKRQKVSDLEQLREVGNE